MLGGALQSNRWAPAIMGVGMVTMCATLGLKVGLAGDALGIDSDLIRVVGAWLLIGFGLVMLVPCGSPAWSHRWSVGQMLPPLLGWASFPLLGA